MKDKVLIAHPESGCAIWCTRVQADLHLAHEPLCVEVPPGDPSYEEWARIATPNEVKVMRRKEL